jgi:glycine/D-amino acid oxidase-like deaminating enzyme
VLAYAGAAALTPAWAHAAVAPPLRVSVPPLTLDPATVQRITVCTRPLRPTGPRIEAETLGAKRLVHNYGHGGAGWSLSWGSADLAVRLALKDRPAQVAVVGAGVIGLTTAIRLAQAGVRVTIYAREFSRETRSALATGAWSPDSRIAVATAVDDAFTGGWRALALASYAAHGAFLKDPRLPVEETPRFTVADLVPLPRPRPPGARRVRWFSGPHAGMGEPSRTVPAGDHPFGARRVRAGASMTFNISQYTQVLWEMFERLGGRAEQATFADQSEILRLTEPVIVNCTGYDARALFGDETIIPIRGQIAWLPPQPQALYGVYYRNVNVLSRRDGLAVQQLGAHSGWGFDDKDVTPDPAEFEAALRIIAPLFENWPA